MRREPLETRCDRRCHRLCHRLCCHAHRAASGGRASGHRTIGAQEGWSVVRRIPRAVDDREVGIAAPHGAAAGPGPEALLRMVGDDVGAGRALLKRQIAPRAFAVQVSVAQQRVRLEPHLVPIVVYILAEQVAPAELPVVHVTNRKATHGGPTDKHPQPARFAGALEIRAERRIHVQVRLAVADVRRVEHWLFLRKEEGRGRSGEERVAAWKHVEARADDNRLIRVRFSERKVFAQHPRDCSVDSTLPCARLQRTIRCMPAGADRFLFVVHKGSESGGEEGGAFLKHAHSCGDGGRERSPIHRVALDWQAPAVPFRIGVARVLLCDRDREGAALRGQVRHASERTARVDKRSKVTVQDQQDTRHSAGRRAARVCLPRAVGRPHEPANVALILRCPRCIWHGGVRTNLALRHGHTGRRGETLPDAARHAAANARCGAPRSVLRGGRVYRSVQRLAADRRRTGCASVRSLCWQVQRRWWRERLTCPIKQR
eukprot:4939493-Prymnesium_polylepis.2